MSIQYKILLSRFLTRFGDQAWDFAVPIILIQLFPGKIQLISLLYLFSKAIQVFFGPKVLSSIDNYSRKYIYKLGIGAQTISLAITFIIILLQFKNTESYSDLNIILIFAFLAILTSAANLGSSLMDAAVGLDLAIDLLQESELTEFNSRLKRIDLATEVTAPLVTGLLLGLSWHNQQSSIGIIIIAVLNIITFIPEYILLSSIPNLDKGKVITIKDKTQPKLTFLKSLKISFSKLRNQIYTPVIISYALLWLSILSPHGVLLTSYLKDGAGASEFIIGVFRGLGAVFGLIPTFIYPILKRKYGMVNTSRLFLISQFFFVVCSGIAFYFINLSLYPLLIFILLSRIGLYGFSIGETEIRQKLIPRESRGEVNGIASSITSAATLFLFFLGTIFGSLDTFWILISASIIAVGLGLVTSFKIKTI